MYVAITKGVKVSVEVYYQDAYSKPRQLEFAFAYHVVIENQTDFAIQLLSREWHIFDSDGKNTQVKGDGVVGKQPTIAPGQSYNYMSGCMLNSELGRMYGTYTILNLNKHKKFQVNIPAFELVVPTKLN
jgi:ApaG protein